MEQLLKEDEGIRAPKSNSTVIDESNNRGTAAKRSRLKATVSAIEGRLSKLKNKEVTPEQAPAGRIEKFFRYNIINHSRN